DEQGGEVATYKGPDGTDVIDGLAWSPDGTRVALLQRHPGGYGDVADLAVFSVRDQAATAFDLPGGRRPAHAAWAPDGGFLYARVLSSDGTTDDVYRINPTTKEAAPVKEQACCRALTPVPSGGYVVISPEA